MKAMGGRRSMRITRADMTARILGMLIALCVLAGSFRGVRYGAAWWFCDHPAGIRDTLEIYARQGQLKSFFGMLTDSRSFLSYVRHDYFRRIACDLVADWVDRGEYMGNAPALLDAICCGNARAFCTRD